MEYLILILLAVTLVASGTGSVMILRQAHALQALRLLAEQTQAGLRAENETTRNAIRTTETTGAERLAGLRGALDVRGEDFATRPRAFDGIEVDVQFTRQPARFR